MLAQKSGCVNVLKKVHVCEHPTSSPSKDVYARKYFRIVSIHAATWCNMVQHGATWCNMVQDSAIQCKMQTMQTKQTMQNMQDIENMQNMQDLQNVQNSYLLTERATALSAV